VYKIPFVTTLLASGVGHPVSVVVPHDLLQGQILALLETQTTEEGHDDHGLPHKPVGRLHLAEHKLLQGRLLKDGGLVLDVGVEPLDEHGEAGMVLQLVVVFSLQHAVQAGVQGPHGGRGIVLLKPQVFEELDEALLSRGARLKIKIREEVAKLEPGPLVLLAAIVFELAKHLVIRHNCRHDTKRC